MDSGRPDPSDWGSASSSFPSSGDGGDHGYSIPAVPVPTWASLLGVSSEKIQKSTKELVRAFGPRINRQPTQSEVEALQDIVTQRAMIGSFRVPLSAALAFVLWRRGRASFRFPFWQPKFKNTSPGVFPNFTRPILVGDTALVAWHSARFGAYFALSWFGIGVNLTLYSLSVNSVALGTDPRLKDLRKDSQLGAFKHASNNFVEGVSREIPKLSKEELLGLRNRLQEQLVEAERLGQHNHESGAEAQQRREKYRAEGRQNSQLPERLAGLNEELNDFRNISTATLQHVIGRVDKAIELKDNPQEAFRQQTDYEALGGRDADTPAPTNTNTSSYPGTTSAMGLPPRQSTQGAWSRSPETTQTTSSPGQRWDDTASDGLDDDDASPIAPSSGREQPSGGSAWDRIRQQAKNEHHSSGGQPPKSGGSQQNDSWSYSASQESKSLAKDQAQKDFDDMIERERRT